MLGPSAGAFSLAGKSITPRGSRTNKPSTVARFNSVSVIASGSVKLALSNVMNACRSDGPNESTSSSTVGVAEREGVGCAGDFGAVCGADVGAGDWAARFEPRTKITNVASKNRDITIIQ